MQTSAKVAAGPQRGLEERRQRRIRILHLFQERVKELAATMLQDDAQDIAALMREVVAMLPSAWQYPAETSARILLDQQVLSSGDRGAALKRSGSYPKEVSSHLGSVPHRLILA